MMLCREVGCVVGQAALKDEEGENISRRSYSASLLSDRAYPDKTLAECFPGLKLNKRAKK